MGFSHEDVAKFQDLFTSNTSAYGTTLVGEIKDGKAQSESRLVHDELSFAVLQRHLNGEQSVGAAPLREGDTVRWCAIDIDNYTYNIYDIVEAIEDFNIPLMPCLSKSKKLHIYCFFSEEVEAEEAVALLKWYLAAFRCDPKTEIFPKQVHTSSKNKFYSWINLPYFAADSDNWRKNVIKKGEYRSLQDFIAIAHERQMTIEQHREAIQKLPLYNAPPCVLSGALLRDVGPGIRNNWFFNVACFLRMQDESIDLEEPLLELNGTLHSPLPEREIRTTVSKVSSKSYFYQCAGMIGCNKKACQNTESGIGNSTDTAGFDLGQLTKIMTDPIQWEWEVNGQKLAFHTTEQIMNQEIFRKLCMEKLDKLPYAVKKERWTKIIGRALDNVVHKEVDLRGDFGKGSEFLDVLAAFFAGGRRRATSITQVFSDKVYLDPNNNNFTFTAHSLQTYLVNKHGMQISPGEIRARMVDLGAEKNGDLWVIPKDNVPEYNVPEMKVDYHNIEGMEDTGVGF